jgi:hypothetical protein
MPATLEYLMTGASEWTRHRLSRPLSAFRDETNRNRWTAQAGKWHMGEHVKDHFHLLAGENTDMLSETYGELPANDNSGAHLWVPLLEHRPESQPFFLWLAAIDPHRGYEEGIIENPHTIDDVILPPYVPDTERVRKDFALYYDEISRLDQYVGKVVETLDRQGVGDNTVILFISDNGRPFPRDKTTLYDSGIKTPWIVKWPQTIAPQSETDALVSAVDIARVLKERGHEIERKRIDLKGTIKEIGSYEVPIRVHPQVTATVAVEVVDEEGVVTLEGGPEVDEEAVSEAAADVAEGTETDVDALAEQALEAAREYEEQQAALEAEREAAGLDPSGAPEPADEASEATVEDEAGEEPETG